MGTPTPDLSPEAQAAYAALVAQVQGGPPAPELPDAVFDELDAAGCMDALDELEREARPELEVDWADPDAHDLDTLRWYDERADPYARGAEDRDPDELCLFMLGTHRPHWLYPRQTNKDGTESKRGRELKPGGPLFVSAYQLRERRKSPYPTCDTPFAIDSGGFTELHRNGRYALTPEQYVAQVRALDAQTGTLEWAAIQDWMVEDSALEATGLTVADHQARTLASFLELRRLAPEIRWLPVLQGRTLEDYLAHLDAYVAAGVPLAYMERVGIGSVCRRQASDEIAELVEALAERGLRLHGFGVKSQGLAKGAPYLASSDSLAWSKGAMIRFPGQQNSQQYAEAYRARMEGIIAGQTELADPKGVE
jgi:hypothetical protein